MNTVTQTNATPEELTAMFAEKAKQVFAEFSDQVLLSKDTIIGMDAMCSILGETSETVRGKYLSGEYDFITQPSSRKYQAKVGDVINCKKCKNK